jgi:hypothetical protein
MSTVAKMKTNSADSMAAPKQSPVMPPRRRRHSRARASTINSEAKKGASAASIPARTSMATDAVQPIRPNNTASHGLVASMNTLPVPLGRGYGPAAAITTIRQRATHAAAATAQAPYAALRVNISHSNTHLPNSKRIAPTIANVPTCGSCMIRSRSSVVLPPNKPSQRSQKPSTWRAPVNRTHAARTRKAVSCGVPARPATLVQHPSKAPSSKPTTGYQ